MLGQFLDLICLIETQCKKIYSKLYSGFALGLK